MFGLFRFSIVLVALQVSVGYAAEWKVTKPAWTATDEQNYSEFVHAIGSSGCNNINSCLKNPANPYRKTDPANIKFFADCAKLPYILRGYFAFKNGLPFSYVNDVKARGASHDLRYSPNGNVVSSRRDVIGVTDGLSALVRMSGEVDSAMFRVAPEYDSNVANYPDFYSAALDRNGIRPGTAIYDPAGHVAVVYSVTDDGRILYMDSHPDNSLTHGQYGEKFARSRPSQGAGFKNFRSLALVGGAVVAKKNVEMKDFSLAQYYGNQPSADGAWSKGKFVFQGAQQDYYDFLRLSLAKGELKYNPVTELETKMKALCGDLQDRVTAVQNALAAGVERKTHPSQLPQNIFGTDGEWESFASPSRDARLKTSFAELRTQIQKLVEMFHHGDPLVVYTGNNLGADLRAAYTSTANLPECRISYIGSDQVAHQLSYEEIVPRVFKMSFDPYDCAELRWGADERSHEFAGCREDRNKLDWYDAEQDLRNQITRTYDQPMGFSLDQLQHHVSGTGIVTPPDIDLPSYLQNI
jgi:hypothetical protein